MQGVVKTKMSTWYSGYLFISEFISNILSKQSAALLAAHDNFIMPFHGFATASATKDCRWCCNLSPKLIFSRTPADASTMPLLVDLSHSWVWDKIKTCSLFHSAEIHLSLPVKLFQLILCLHHHLLFLALSFLLFVIDKLQMVPLEVPHISRRFCTEIRSFTYSVSPQSPSLTVEIDPTPTIRICRAFFAPWCGNTSSLLVTSSCDIPVRRSVLNG